MISLLAQIWFVIVFAIIFLTISNIIYCKLFVRIVNKTKQLPISIIIPVRNEAKVIKRALENLHFCTGEVLVINDGSTDATVKIVKEYSRKHKNITLRTVKKPKGWMGKNYACHMGAKFAKFDTLAFIDADVAVNPAFLEKSAHLMKNSRIDFLSYFPKQQAQGLVQFITPVLNWFFLTSFPAFLQKLNWPILAAANGQCILISSRAYKRCGHKDVKDLVADDMQLVRLYAKNKLLRRAIYTNEIKCKMYYYVPDAITGFVKNFYNASGLPKFTYTVWLTVLSLFYLAPLFLFFVEPLFSSVIFASLLLWICVYVVQGYSPLVALYPVQIILILFVGLYSAYRNKGVLWKGRKV